MTNPVKLPHFLLVGEPDFTNALGELLAQYYEGATIIQMSPLSGAGHELLSHAPDVVLCASALRFVSRYVTKGSPDSSRLSPVASELLALACQAKGVPFVLVGAGGAFEKGFDTVQHRIEWPMLSDDVPSFIDLIESLGGVS